MPARDHGQQGHNADAHSDGDGGTQPKRGGCAGVQHLIVSCCLRTVRCARGVLITHSIRNIRATRVARAVTRATRACRRIIAVHCQPPPHALHRSGADLHDDFQQAPILFRVALSFGQLLVPADCAPVTLAVYVGQPQLILSRATERTVCASTVGARTSTRSARVLTAHESTELVAYRCAPAAPRETSCLAAARCAACRRASAASRAWTAWLGLASYAAIAIRHAEERRRAIDRRHRGRDFAPC